VKPGDQAALAKVRVRRGRKRIRRGCLPNPVLTVLVRLPAGSAPIVTPTIARTISCRFCSVPESTCGRQRFARGACRRAGKWC